MAIKTAHTGRLSLRVCRLLTADLPADQLSVCVLSLVSKLGVKRLIASHKLSIF